MPRRRPPWINTFDIGPPLLIGSAGSMGGRRISHEHRADCDRPASAGPGEPHHPTNHHENSLTPSSVGFYHDELRRRSGRDITWGSLERAGSKPSHPCGVASFAEPPFLSPHQ